jgi:Transmembrane domain of unknown function (DUF3566)
MIRTGRRPPPPLRAGSNGRTAEAVPRAGFAGARYLKDLPLRPRLPIRRDRTPTDATSSGTRSVGWRVEPTHRLEGFELPSVARASVRYYAGAFAALALAVVLVWVGASALGAVDRVEHFMRTIGFRDFHFTGVEVIFGGVLLCIAGVAFFTVMTVLAAAFYNLPGRPKAGVGIRLAPISSTQATASPEQPEHDPHGNGQDNGR